MKKLSSLSLNANELLQRNQMTTVLGGGGPRKLDPNCDNFGYGDTVNPGCPCTSDSQCPRNLPYGENGSSQGACSNGRCI